MVNGKRCAIVTGAARGIGKGISMALANDGYAVCAVGTRPADDERVAAYLTELQAVSPESFYVQGDISVGEDREKIMNEAWGKFGTVEILVNNAGVAPTVRNDILEMTEESYDYVMDINLKGTFFLTQLAANRMKEQNSGSICNISSISAYTSSVNRGEYCISKSGLSMVTKLFADRLAEYGITVNEVRPGIIATDMTEKVQAKYDSLIDGDLLPIKRWGQPEDIAAAVWALCSGALPYVTGQSIDVDGGFHIRRL